jgi:hypothetical protein
MIAGKIVITSLLISIVSAMVAPKGERLGIFVMVGIFCVVILGFLTLISMAG